MGGPHATEISGNKEEQVALICTLEKTRKYKLFSLETSQTTKLFSKMFPSSFILYFKKLSNEGFCTSFTLKRCARNRLVSAHPYNHNMLDWFTWGIIYQFLWDCAQNKVLFSVMAESFWGNATSYVLKEKEERHTHTRRVKGQIFLCPWANVFIFISLYHFNLNKFLVSQAKLS